MKINQELRKFLRSECCLDEYITNCKEFSGVDEKTVRYLSREKGILQAFNWDLTKEGHNYWSVLNQKYENESYMANIYVGVDITQGDDE